MDFTVFDYPEHMSALSWLGKRDWIYYKDYTDHREITAKPRPLFLKPKTTPTADALVVSEKEYYQHPKEMWDTIQQLFSHLEDNVICTLWYHTLSKSLADGPKIFKPTVEQCEALENAEARYAFKDYHQPFPVIILEIPEEYKNKLKNKYVVSDLPNYVLVSHDQSHQFINVSAFIDKTNVITHLAPNRQEYDTIEDNIVKNRERRQGATDSDFNAAENVQRLGINFAMMMSLYTVKISGHLDPYKYKLWKAESTSKRKNGEFTNKAIEAQQKLLASMQLLKFDQNVQFYDEIEENIEVGIGVDIEKLHKSPKSHWRRGHFAMQACGVGRRDRKMIFRKPILVRANYFVGHLKDASVTYTMKTRFTKSE